MVKISKKLIMLSLMVLTSMVIISCSDTETTTSEETTTETQINHTFDMDAVYYSGDGYEVTFKELFDSIKTNDGADQLIEMVDREILSDYFNLISTEDIENKRIQLIYGTNDQEIIDDIDEDKVTDMIKSYNDGMVVLGFSEDDTPYLELLVARDLYVKELLTNPDIEDNNLYINALDIAEEYTKRRTGEVNAILVRYESSETVTSLLRENNLVEYNGELRLYTDESVPLSSVPSHRLNDENTRSLTEAELLQYFIEFYNEAYDGQRDPILETSSLEDLLVNDALVFDYEALSDINVKLGNLLFTGLSTMVDQENIYYTYKPFEVKITNRNNYYLILNLDRDYVDLSGFDGDQAELINIIGEDVYTDIQNDLVNTLLKESSFVGRQLKTLREEHDFEIFDYYLKLDYESVVPRDMEKTNFNQSDFVIATLDGEDILVKDLMAFALERKAPLYLLHAAQLDILRLTHYEDVYCDDEGNCELDYTQNNSGAMNTHIASYAELENSFNESQYANYYTFADYLYLAYGVKNDVEMINSYVKRTLEPLFIYNYVLENKDQMISEMMPIINEYYDNYFSLDVRHILIYIDDNGDGNPDDYEEYYEGLEDGQAEFDTMVSNFRTDIITYLSENDDDLALVVSTYEKASSTDELWGAYKRAGLRILTENLSAQKSLTYTNTYKAYEDGFVDGLVSTYQQYQLTENIDKDFIYSDVLIETSYGLHIVKAEKGDDFELPSAEFTVSEDTTFNYPDGLNNTEFRLSASQIEVYFSYRVFDIASTVVNLETIFDFEKPDLPSRIEDLMALFVRDLYDAYYITAYLNMGMMDILSEGSIIDNSEYSFFTEAELAAYFADLEEAYSGQMLGQFK